MLGKGIKISLHFLQDRLYQTNVFPVIQGKAVDLLCVILSKPFGGCEIAAKEGSSGYSVMYLVNREGTAVFFKNR